MSAEVEGEDTVDDALLREVFVGSGDGGVAADVLGWVRRAQPLPLS